MVREWRCLAVVVSPRGRRVKILASRRRVETLDQKVKTFTSLPHDRMVEMLGQIVETLGRRVETLASLPRDRMVETLGQIVKTLGHRVETFGCRVEMLDRILETLASLPPYQRVEMEKTENRLALKWKEIVCYTKSFYWNLIWFKMLLEQTATV